MQNISFMASQVEQADVQQNDIYMSVLMRLFSTRSNRNGYAVTEAFIDNIVANQGKYTCLPLCANADKLRSGDTQGQTHMLDAQTSTFESEQIGSFFSFAKAKDEFGVSLIGEARIPKRNPVLCETLQRMYEAGTLAFSFEIMVTHLAEEGGVRIIDAADGNELIGMAVVTTPAYPEATALRLVAEQDGKDDTNMDESQKRIAELETQLKQAEQKSETDEELRKKDEALEDEKQKREQVEAELSTCREDLSKKDTRIAELEAKVAELEPFKAEAEQLKQDKAAAELAAKQQELTSFAETQGLDVKETAIAEAIQKADYAALVAAAVKQPKSAAKPTMASYALNGGLATKGDYDDLLAKA